MKALLLLPILAVCCQDPPPRAEFYARCTCRSGVVGCKDSITRVNNVSTESCPSGAVLDVICAGAGCPPQCAAQTDDGGVL